MKIEGKLVILSAFIIFTKYKQVIILLQGRTILMKYTLALLG